MRNIDKYIAQTRKHVPEKYDLTCHEMKTLAETYGIYDVIVRSFLIGFEAAYRAAKAGNLDFQKK
ncbi:MAG: hypothetical protein ACOX8H_01590 [Ruminococcus sp.]|jgi:hypothetical protein